MNSFDQAFGHVLNVEGREYTNHPKDRGGPTKFGITQQVLGSFRKTQVTEADVQSLQESEARVIYKTMYWDPLRLDEVINPVIAKLVFDQAVNRGVVTVAKQLQRTVGVIPDGVVGPKTIQAVNTLNSRRFVVEFVKGAQLSYVSICVKDPTQLVFLKGWMNRTHQMLEALFDIPSP